VFAIHILPYAILNIAAEVVNAGNWIVNVPAVAVLSPPKSNTATAELELDVL
jgi:hypothetical protein